jgi:hypothetical protein
VPLGEPVPRPAVPWTEVRVFLNEGDVPGPFEKIPLITAKGDYDATSDREMVDKFRKEAGKVGANAIILEDIKEPSTGAKIVDAVLGVPAERRGRVLAVRYTAGEKQQAP